jgi:glycosyltransferase involved in cell wall biosynthesis
MTQPKVSIGLPVFNGEQYLRAALDSILSQDYQDFELIISDNASDDATAAICREAAERDPRVRYSRVETNCGAAPNYQRAFQLARGTYFKWANDDDICLPGFLRRCVETIEQAPSSIVLAYPRAEYIDEEGKVTGTDHESIESSDQRPHRRAAHVFRNVNLGCAQFGLIRSEVLRKTRSMDSFIGSDYVLLAELALLGELREIPEILFQKRIYPGNSNVYYTDQNQWLAWMDSSHAGRRELLPTYLRIGWEFNKSISRLPLTAKEKALCRLAVSSTWYLRNLRRIGGRYKLQIRRGLGVGWRAIRGATSL